MDTTHMTPGARLMYRFYRREALRMLRLRREVTSPRSKAYYAAEAAQCLRNAAYHCPGVAA